MKGGTDKGRGAVVGIEEWFVVVGKGRRIGTGKGRGAVAGADQDLQGLTVFLFHRFSTHIVSINLFCFVDFFQSL